MTATEIIDLVKGCCTKLPNGNYRFTPAGKIRLKEILGEHGIVLEMDESDEIKEFQVNGTRDGQ